MMVPVHCQRETFLPDAIIMMQTKTGTSENRTAAMLESTVLTPMAINVLLKVIISNPENAALRFSRKLPIERLVIRQNTSSIMPAAQNLIPTSSKGGK